MKKKPVVQLLKTNRTTNITSHERDAGPKEFPTTDWRSKLHMIGTNTLQIMVMKFKMIRNTCNGDCTETSSSSFYHDIPLLIIAKHSKLLILFGLAIALL